MLQEIEGAPTCLRTSRQYRSLGPEPSQTDNRAVETPRSSRLSPDGRSWWTGETWVPPRYERTGLSALVTFVSRFMGALRVSPGAVVFACAAEGLPGAANKAMNVERPPVTVVHTDPRVALICARFAIPWLNRAVVLVDPEVLNAGTAVVQFPAWEQRGLVDALQRAAFTVDLHATAFSIGSNIGSQAELERLRGNPDEPH